MHHHGQVCTSFAIGASAAERSISNALLEIGGYQYWVSMLWGVGGVVLWASGYRQWIDWAWEVHCWPISHR